MNYFFMPQKHKTMHKTTHQNTHTKLKNIRADLLVAVVGALNLDSQRPGHLLLPWALAIEQWSQCRECIVLWPSKWPRNDAPRPASSSSL